MSNDPIVITVVCTANVCRSPMAEGLLRHALQGEDSPPAFIVESAGVAAREGEGPSENSVIAMKKVGIDISDHKSRMLTPDRVARSHVIFCMTSDHQRMIETLHPQTSGQLRLFCEFSDGNNPEVPDPYGGFIDEYIECRDSLVEAIPGLLRFLYQEVFPSPK